MHDRHTLCAKCRPFQRRGAVIDMARLENMRRDSRGDRWSREVTIGRERMRQGDDKVELFGWMVKSSRRYVDRGDCFQ